MVFPGMVYLSWPTELGTLYTRAELGEIHKVCRQYKDTAVPGRRRWAMGWPAGGAA